MPQLPNRAGGFMVTRGFGGSPTHILARGFLPVLLEQVTHTIRGAGIYGKKKFNELIDEIKIASSLIAFNGKDLVSPILNTVRQTYKDEPSPRIEAKPIRLSVKSPEIKVSAKIKKVRNKHVND